MKLIDSVILITVCFLYTTGLYGALGQMKQISEKSRRLEKEISANRFIEQSFRKTCEGCLYKDLNQWQSECRNMYNLEYIAWCNAEEFMDVSYENCDDLLFYGIWELNDKKCEVYSRYSINKK